MNVEFTQFSERHVRVAIVLAIAVAGLLTYANSFHNGFVWDDVSSVILNKHIQKPAYFFRLFREDQHPFGRGQGNFYRPLLAADFMADYVITKSVMPPGNGQSSFTSLNPVLFHLSNTAWHIMAAVLLFALMTRLRAPNFARAVVPLLYVVHPLHTEAVTYISGRADSMAAVFMFAGIWLALWRGTSWRRVAGIILSALCFCGALLSKESGTIFPVLLVLALLADPVETENRKREYILRAIPAVISFILLGVYAWLRMTVLHFASSNPPDSSFGQRLTGMLQAFAIYLRLLIVPTGLHMERSLLNVSGWVALAGFLLLAAILAGLILSLVRKQRRIAFALAWFLATWLPISGIFPLNAPMAEHWLYLPMAGLLWAIAEALWLMCSGRTSRVLLVAASCAAGVVFVALSVDRNRDWHDNERLFVATLDKNPLSIRVRYNLAVTYEDLLGNLPAARRQYEKVIELYKNKKALEHASGPEKFWDDEIESHISLGKIFLKNKQFAQAADHYSAVLRSSAADNYKTAAAFGLGKCCLATGDSQHAIEFFRQVAAAQPEMKNEIAAVLRGDNT